jgi:hypothetical protein
MLKKAVDDGKQESSRFTGSCLGASDDIPAL